LAINHRSLLQIACRGLFLLKNDHAQEVRLRAIGELLHACGNTFKITPKRIPLLLLIPDIRALEQWNKQPLWLHENGLGSSHLCIHLICLTVLMLGYFTYA
jgi:hypothetical protein